MGGAARGGRARTAKPRPAVDAETLAQRAAAKAAKKAHNATLAARRFMLHPTPAQRKTLDALATAYLWTYNQCVCVGGRVLAAAEQSGCVETLVAARTRVEALGGDKKAGKARAAYRRLQDKHVFQPTRSACVHTSINLPSAVAAVHSEIRDSAYLDWRRGRLGAISNVLAGHQEPGFLMHTKRMSNTSRVSICVRSRLYNAGAVSALLHSIEAKPPLPERSEADVRLVRLHGGRWRVDIPCVVTPQPPPPQSRPLSVAAIDPGGRTFLTVYVASEDPRRHGTTVELGNDADAQAIRWLRAEAARLKGRSRTLLTYRPYIDKNTRRRNAARPHKRRPAVMKRRRRRGLRRAAAKRRRRAGHLITEIHNKAAHWLLSQHDAVIAPKLATKSIVANSSARPLHAGAKRGVLLWRHARWQAWLAHKARYFPACTLVDDFKETYTTQACGACGTLNRRVGAAHEYTCPKVACDYRGVPRDVHGARNILIKFMTEMCDGPGGDA